ncbi:MAG: ABC transporter substrate-binding protein [Burkholderiaceae bacterium]
MLLLAGVVALGGCQPPPVRIGFIGGLRGRLSDLVADGRNGAQLAVETLNEKGGRQRYELMVHDDEPDAGAIGALVDAAADRGDAFAVGPMTSSLAAGLLDEANRRRFVMISPTANSGALSKLDDYLFRVAAAAGPGAERLAQVAIDRGLETAAVMMDWRNRSYSEDFAKAFAVKFQALGGTRVEYVRYETRFDPDFADVAAQLLASHPKIVLLASGSIDASMVAQKLRRMDPKVALAVASWTAHDQFLQLGGPAVEGALVLQPLDLDSKAPSYLDFLRRYRARFGMAAGPAAALSYEAAMVGADAMKKTSPGRSLRDVLRVPGDWPGLQGPVVLDRFGDSGNRFFLSEVRGGRFTMLGDAAAKESRDRQADRP